MADSPPVVALVPARPGGATIADVLSAYADARLHTARLTSALAQENGINPTDLRAFIFIGGEHEVTPKRVADWLMLTTGAVTALIDRLEVAGLVDRTVNPSDRRSTRLHVTTLGDEVLTAVANVYEQAFSSALESHELDGVYDELTRIAAAIGRAADKHHSVRASASARRASS